MSTKKECPECAHLQGRAKDVCDGSAIINGNPIGLDASNAWRLANGIIPHQAEKGSSSARYRGAGDLIAAGIKAITFGKVLPCGGCKGRQQWLNEHFPFSQKSAETIQQESITTMNWAYGITTVRQRLNDGLLARTIESLKNAGFDQPRLFIDDHCEGYDKFGLPITCRGDQIRAYGNWLLALIELYIRNPLADRFAIFQDDLVTCRGLKDYLSQAPYPEKGYLNLYTFPHNQPDQLAQRMENGMRTHASLNPNHIGFYPSEQWGKGAVALVFNLEALMTLLSQMHTYARIQDVDDPQHNHRGRGHKAIDGAVVEGMKQAGYLEYVHNPSLVQHTGLQSSMGNPRHQLAISFQGESWDARTLLNAG